MQEGSKYTGLKNVADAYKYYKKESVRNTMEYKEYSRIAFLFFKEILLHLLDGGEVKFPGGLGLFKIVKKPRRFDNLRVDWKSTKDMWEKNPKTKENKKLVYHLNDHTRGYYYRFFWSKGIVTNISAYSFVPVRKAQRDLASRIKKEKKDYIG